MSKLIKVTYYHCRKGNWDTDGLKYTSYLWCNSYEYDSLMLGYYLHIEFKGKEYISNFIPDYQFKTAEVIDHD